MVLIKDNLIFIHTHDNAALRRTQESRPHSRARCSPDMTRHTHNPTSATGTTVASVLTHNAVVGVELERGRHVVGKRIHLLVAEQALEERKYTLA